jgi:HEPN domain-containing protein
MMETPSIEALSVFAEATQDLVTAGLEQALGRNFACVDACNQVAEKALQSISIARTGHRAPYNHDLQALGESLTAPATLLEALAHLSPYHPEHFYQTVKPELADDAVSSDEVVQCMALARQVLRWARSIVTA